MTLWFSIIIRKAFEASFQGGKGNKKNKTWWVLSLQSWSSPTLKGFPPTSPVEQEAAHELFHYFCRTRVLHPQRWHLAVPSPALPTPGHQQTPWKGDRGKLGTSLGQTKFVSNQIWIFRWKGVVFSEFRVILMWHRAFYQLNWTLVLLNPLPKEQLKPTSCSPIKT